MTSASLLLLRNGLCMNDTDSAQKLTLPSPAKLNLFLHITGQRPDGYHNLQTIFQFLNYYDTLHFQLNDSNNLSLTPALEGVSNEDNLIIKAARLLQKHSGCELGADIKIEKVLPMGGGLGGGSSNAATTLLALNKLWRLNRSEERRVGKECRSRWAA